MGEVSAIAWTHATFNAWIGCARVSPACENCYAESLAKARFEGPPGKKVPLWGVDAARKTMSEDYWRAPLKWNRDAQAAGERRRVFCSSLADVFEIAIPRNVEAAEVLRAARARLWPLIEQTPWLDWLLLTKRPENIGELVPGWGRSKPWPANVWLGTTAEDQRRADERIPHLLTHASAVRFVSHEPALSYVDFRKFIDLGIDWVITGGESGPKARPYSIDWAARVIEQCREHGAAPFVKQLGSFPVGEGPKYPHIKLAHAKGENPAEWPEALRVREFPTPRATA